MNVRSKVKKETGQVPWELSSLIGDFFFAPGKGAVAVAGEEAPVTASAATDALDEESKKLDAEQQRLEQEKASLEKQKVLNEKRRKLEEARKQLEAEKEAQSLAETEKPSKSSTLAMGPRPSAVRGNEIRRDSRFIAYDDGTVLDTKTNLMWAAKDYGSDIDWQGAKSYCENYRGGGYTDWRLPTHDELKGLYDESKTYKTPFGDNARLTELIRLTTNWVWTSDTSGSNADKFNFFFYFPGARNSHPQSFKSGQALPVRSAIPEVSETGRDGHFIAYNNGTVLDTKTGLMWAAKDNGSDINYGDATSYCENYRGGGYTDWRRPTQDELAGLYDAGKSQHQECNPPYKIHVATGLIHLTCYETWASGFISGADVSVFNFVNGRRYSISGAGSNGNRALPVRSAK